MIKMVTITAKIQSVVTAQLHRHSCIMLIYVIELNQILSIFTG